MLTRREADALDRYLTAVPDDGPDGGTCPVCQVREAGEVLEEGFMAPDGWEPPTVAPCRACAAPCVACAAEGVVKGRGGRCADCDRRRTAKERRAHGWQQSRPARRFRQRLAAFMGWGAAWDWSRSLR